MIIYIFLDWAGVAVSLANTVLLLWLGFTILLNAEKRYWGVWLSGGGLLIGGVFFISHTAILGHGLTSLDNGLTFWWYLGLAAALISPITWYVVVLWYVGYWEKRDSDLRRRQRPWFALNMLLALVMGILLIFANPFPSYQQVATLNLSPTPNIVGVPILILIYATSTMLSVALSLDALWHPGPTRRLMADIARERARPWLVATAIDLILVGLSVAGVMLSVVLYANELARAGMLGVILTYITVFDLVISCEILAAVIFIGQAVVGYEVFTGKTLPQRRFMRHWHNAVTLAFGYGAVMSGVLELHLHPINALLLMAIMMTVFYSLFSRMSYQERERYIQDLRPFVLSQRLYDQLITGSVPADIDISRPFQALCGEVLGAQMAYLTAVGPLAPLVGPALTYPGPAPAITWSPVELASRFTSPQTICVEVDQAHYGGAMWAVPLWSERGLIGVLLLGPKRNGSLYTQEEMEIARASGERLIDTQASAEMARRLMGLQRQRLAESQIVDRRTRRKLHDDVLPQLHAAMLTLSAAQGDARTSADVVNLLANLHHEIADLLHEMPGRAAPAVAQNGLVAALHKVLDEEFADAFDGVTWQIAPQAESEAQRIPLLTSEVLYYAAREAIRNAARYGRGGQPDRALHLCIQLDLHNEFALVIEDDGIGHENAEPSTGSGHGLALHGTMMAVVGGTLAIDSAPGQFTRVSLSLPPTPPAPSP